MLDACYVTRKPELVEYRRSRILRLVSEARRGYPFLQYTNLACTYVKKVNIINLSFVAKKVLAR